MQTERNCEILFNLLINEPPRIARICSDIEVNITRSTLSFSHAKAQRAQSFFVTTKGHEQKLAEVN